MDQDLEQVCALSENGMVVLRPLLSLVIVPVSWLAFLLHLFKFVLSNGSPRSVSVPSQSDVYSKSTYSHDKAFRLVSRLLSLMPEIRLNVFCADMAYTVQSLSSFTRSNAQLYFSSVPNSFAARPPPSHTFVPVHHRSRVIRPTLSGCS